MLKIIKESEVTPIDRLGLIICKFKAKDTDEAVDMVTEFALTDDYRKLIPRKRVSFHLID